MLAFVGLRAEQIGAIDLLYLIRFEVGIGETTEIADEKHVVSSVRSPAGVASGSAGQMPPAASPGSTTWNPMMIVRLPVTSPMFR